MVRLLRATALFGAVGMFGACTFLVDLQGLSGGGQSAPPFGEDGGDRRDGQGVDAGGEVGATDSGHVGAGVDGAGIDASGDVALPPCVVPLVQAVPGTSLWQVIQQSTTSKETLSVTQGNLLVVIAYGGQGPGATTPPTTVPNMTFDVSDSLGNTWYAAPMFENAISHQSALQIFYAPNVLGGLDQITVTSAAPGSSVSLWTGALVHEYSGIAATDVVDVSTGRMAGAQTQTPSAGDMTTTAACDLVVGAFADGHVSGQALSAAAGWTTRSTDAWDPSGAVDDAPNGAAAGTVVNAGMNLSQGPDNGWVAAQVAFRAAWTQPAQQPDGIGFSTPARTVAAGACSTAVVLETLRASAPAVTASGIKAALSGPGLTFYADPSCAYPIAGVFIGAGTSSQTLYFKAASAGSRTITASVTGMTPATQGETVN